MPNVPQPDKKSPIDGIVREDELRRQVREALDLGWDARDAQIIAKVKELAACTGSCEDNCCPVHGIEASKAS